MKFIFLTEPWQSTLFCLYLRLRLHYRYLPELKIPCSIYSREMAILFPSLFYDFKSQTKNDDSRFENVGK